MDVNTQGIQDLILAAAEALANFDLKTLDFDWLAELLTMFHPIWNPIWEIVNVGLEKWFGF